MFTMKGYFDDLDELVLDCSDTNESMETIETKHSSGALYH